MFSARLRRRACGVALLSLFMLVLLAVAPARALGNEVSHFRLSNGMEVVVIPDHRAPVVTHMVWYRVGAADEPAGKSGIAHFLEHLMFKGTDQIAPGEFSKIIARNGGKDNAFTSSDYTGYFQRIARDRLRLVMEMEANRMTGLRLRNEDIDPERKVVLEERRSRVDNQPRSRLSEQLDAAFYVAHPYGKPVIGWPEEILALSRKDILDFYRRYYTPNNAILVVAGDITQSELRPMAEEIYGKIEPTGEIGPRVRPVEPPPEAERRVILEDPRVRTAQISRSYLTPSYSTAGEGEAEALDVLTQILGGDSTSRLYRKLMVEEKIASGVAAWYSGDQLDHGRIGIYVIAMPGSAVRDVEAAADRVIAEIVRDGVSHEETARAIRSLVAQAVYARDSQSALARIFGVALTTGQTVEDVTQWTERIKAVSPEAVQKAARAYLQAKRSATGVLLPAKQVETAPATAPAKEKKS